MRRKGDSPEPPPLEPVGEETLVPKKLARRAAHAYTEVEFTLKAPSSSSMEAAMS